MDKDKVRVLVGPERFTSLSPSRGPHIGMLRELAGAEPMFCWQPLSRSYTLLEVYKAADMWDRLRSQNLLVWLALELDYAMPDTSVWAAFFIGATAGSLPDAILGFRTRALVVMPQGPEHAETMEEGFMRLTVCRIDEEACRRLDACLAL